MYKGNLLSWNYILEWFEFREENKDTSPTKQPNDDNSDDEFKFDPGFLDIDKQ